jgi:acetyl esterase/lipase
MHSDKAVPQSIDASASCAPAPDALRQLYLSWGTELAARPDITIPEMRVLFDHWGDVTAEPRGIDYTEIDAGGVPALWITPHRAANAPVLLCIHGGGYIGGSMYSHRKMFGHFAKSVGCRALAIDYRLAPDHPHPAALDDCVVVYKWLLQVEGLSPEDIAFIGDSAGGALAITTMLRAREVGLPLPAASAPLSPWFDMRARGHSHDTNAHLDALVSRETIQQMATLAAGPDGNILDPLLNPLNTDQLQGLPPIFIQVSGAETLLDDSVLFTERARSAGVDVTIQIVPGMQHVFHFMAGAHLTADAAIAAVAEWLRARLSLT